MTTVNKSLYPNYLIFQLMCDGLKMVEPIFDYQFRLILIGDSTVGKSSLLKYFTDGKFAEVGTILFIYKTARIIQRLKVYLF